MTDPGELICQENGQKGWQLEFVSKIPNFDCSNWEHSTKNIALRFPYIEHSISNIVHIEMISQLRIFINIEISIEIVYQSFRKIVEKPN